MEAEEEIKKIPVKEFRKEIDFLFKDASNMKYDIRFNKDEFDKLIESSDVFAEKLDRLIQRIEKETNQNYYDYTMWFDKNYDLRESYNSNKLFKQEEIDDFDSEDSRMKNYFNYCMEHLIVINYFIMTLEFNELYESCKIEKQKKIDIY